MAGNDPLVQDANIRDSIPGLSYRADIVLNHVVGRSGAANFPVLTQATNPLIFEGGSAQPIVKFAASDTTTLLLSHQLPGEFDPDANEIKVILLAGASSITDPNTLNVSISRTKANVAANQQFVGSSAAAGVAPAAYTDGVAQQITPVTPSRYTWTFTDVFAPNDGIHIKITPGGTATDSVYLYGVTLRIRRHAALRYMPDRTN